MNEVPDATVNLYGHVHNNEPLREGPYVNICVEHTEYRPLSLDAVRRLALARLDDPRPRAATTAEEIRCLDTSSTTKGGRGGQNVPGGGAAERDVPQRGMVPTPVVRGTTFGDDRGRIIVSFSLASRPSFSTYCSATRNCAA